MKIKRIINIFLCVLLLFISSACSTKDTATESSAKFVGIAIYQNSTENSKWNNIKDDTSLINNMIETKDNKLVYSDNQEFLFYVYSQNEITSIFNDSDFISNTTRDVVEIKNNTLIFTLERIAENTDVLVYFIYKNDDGYFLKFIQEENNISKETETINMEINNPHFNKVQLILDVNLSVKKEY